MWLPRVTNQDSPSTLGLILTISKKDADPFIHLFVGRSRAINLLHWVRVIRKILPSHH
jgi:hypothetical protein